MDNFKMKTFKQYLAEMAIDWVQEEDDFVGYIDPTKQEFLKVIDHANSKDYDVRWIFKRNE